MHLAAAVRLVAPRGLAGSRLQVLQVPAYRRSPDFSCGVPVNALVWIVEYPAAPPLADLHDAGFGVHEQTINVEVT